MTAEQLTLEPPPAPTPRTTQTYFVYRVTPKDERTASKRAHRALGMYTARFLHTPREIRCHAANAAEIGDTVMGVPVVALAACAPDDFYIPLPER